MWSPIGIECPAWSDGQLLGGSRRYVVVIRLMLLLLPFLYRVLSRGNKFWFSEALARCKRVRPALVHSRRVYSSLGGEMDVRVQYSCLAKHLLPASPHAYCTYYVVASVQASTRFGGPGAAVFRLLPFYVFGRCTLYYVVALLESSR